MRFPCSSGGCKPRDDYVDFETDQLGGQFGKPVGLPLCRPKLESNVLPLNVPQIAQPLPKLPPKLSVLPITSAPMVGTFGCCALAASGQATELLTSVINSRRRMRYPTDQPMGE
jgi:hypothetical protein